MRRPPALVLLLFCAAVALLLFSLVSYDHSAPPPRDVAASYTSPAALAALAKKRAKALEAAAPEAPGAKPDAAVAKTDDAEAHVAESLPVEVVAPGASYWLPPAAAAVVDGTPASTVSGCSPSPGAHQRPLVRIAADPCTADDVTACQLAARAPERSLLLIGVDASAADVPARLELLKAARTAVAPGQLLAVVQDARAAGLAQSLGVGWWRPDLSAHTALATPPASLTATTWHAAAQLLAAGGTVGLSSSRVRWLASPFRHTARDVDVEVAQADGHSSRGAVVGVHDPPMGEDRPASHHITSHHITSHRITSHHITSHHNTSHHITSHHIASHDMT
jgi:hypothetical protein